MAPVTIRPLSEADWPSVWRILEPVFRAGDTYAFSSDISEEEARRIWVDAPEVTFVALGDSDSVVGTYYLRPNQPGAGSHVCNCGYVVAASARGHGVASAMCEHSQREAVDRGYRAMQFNCVVSTNEGAVRLWKGLGFDIVGTIPEGFRHPDRGYVDAYVMYKKLE